MCHNPSTIAIAPIDADDIDTLLNLYVELFHHREPLTACIGLRRARLSEIVRLLYAESISYPPLQQQWWLARDRADNQRAVGFVVGDDPALVTDQALPDNLTVDEQAIFAEVMALLAEVRRPLADQLSAAGTYLHIAAIGVHPQYEGLGIATRLLQAAVADATARGFRYAFAECTSLTSRRLHEKCGFKHLHRVAVTDWAQDKLKQCTVCIDLMQKLLEN